VRVGVETAMPSNGNLFLYANGNVAAQFFPTSLVTQLYGTLQWNSDNANDIGASGANRARDLYLGRNALIGGNIGVGLTNPGANVEIGGTFPSTIASTTFLSNAGSLGTTAGSDLPLASIGFAANNATALGIRALRVANGTDWRTTAIGLGMDVDSSVRAGANLWLSSNGNIGIGTTTPKNLLDVNGALAVGTYAGTNTLTSGYLAVSGRVGIGTATPGQLLDITGNNEPSLQITNTAMAGNPALLLGMNNGNNAAIFQTTGNKAFKFYNGAYPLVATYNAATSTPYVAINQQNGGLSPLDILSNEAGNRAMRITQNVGTGAGNVSEYGLEITGNVTATDGSPQSQGWGGIRVVNNHGLLSTDAGGPVYATGAPGGIGSEVYIKNTKATNGIDESSAYGGAVSYWNEPGTTAPGRAWFTDFALQGPVGIQSDALSAFHMVINNYYNGNPANTANPSGDGWFITQPRAGAGQSTSQSAATTYPVQVGVGIIGYSGTYNTATPGRGFLTALQIGGSGSNWETTQSRSQTGILVRDYDTTGVLIQNPYTAAGGTQTALAVAANAGNVGIGTTSPGGLLQLGAGTATTAPFLLTAGTNLTTPVAGAMEWNGTNLFLTQTAGATRKTLAFTDSALTGSLGFDKLTTGTNTTATMTVGSGGSLTSTGTGVINATQLLGTTWAAPAAIGATTANTGAFTTLALAGNVTFSQAATIAQATSGTNVDGNALTIQAGGAGSGGGSRMGGNLLLQAGSAWSGSALTTGGDVKISAGGNTFTNGFYGNIRFFTGNTPTELMTILASGNVGIGNTTPLAALDVAGGASLSGSLSYSGSGTAHTINVLDNGTYNIQRSAGGDPGVTSSLFIGANGNVGIGDTAPTNAVKVVGSLCVKNATGACSGNTSGTIYATNITVAQADYAENYISSQVLQPGDVVIPASDGNSAAVIKAPANYTGSILGVVSTAPGVSINGDLQTDSTHPHLYPIALVGRAPVKISSQDGTVKSGDHLTVSRGTGVVMKATKAGETVGTALEDDNGSGKIMAYIHTGWFDPSVY